MKLKMSILKKDGSDVYSSNLFKNCSQKEQSELLLVMSNTMLQLELDALGYFLNELGDCMCPVHNGHRVEVDDFDRVLYYPIDSEFIKNSKYKYELLKASEFVKENDVTIMCFVKILGSGYEVFDSQGEVWNAKLPERLTQFADFVLEYLTNILHKGYALYESWDSYTLEHRTQLLEHHNVTVDEIYGWEKERLSMFVNGYPNVNYVSKMVYDEMRMR